MTKQAYSRNAMASMYKLGRMKSGSMNKTEQDYAVHLDELKLAGDVQWWGFECFNLKLTGDGAEQNTFYKPDFAVINAAGELEFHETKGFWTDDAKVKIKVAAGKYPFRFVAMKKLAKKAGGGWVGEDF